MQYTTLIVTAQSAPEVRAEPAGHLVYSNGAAPDTRQTYPGGHGC